MDVWNAFVSALRTFFNPVLTILFAFFNPVIVVFASIASVISWLLGALSNPQGFMNGFVNRTIDVVAVVLPSTPDQLKVSSIVNSVSLFLPAVGKAVIAEIFITISSMFVLFAAVKLYKLIPFKAT